MFCGATFLPPAVTRMSFLRSVIVRKPSSSIEPMSPVLQPAVLVEHGLRRLVVLVVAGEDRRAADEQLAVVGQLQLDAGQRRARRCRSGSARACSRWRPSCTRSCRSPRGWGCRGRGRTRRSPSRAARRPRSRSAGGRRASSSPSSRRACRPACCAASPRGTGRPSCRSSLTRCPTPSAQSISFRLTPVASSKLASTAVCTFSYTRGTLGSTVGRTDGSHLADPQRVGAEGDREADVGGEEVQAAAEVVRERQVEQHGVLGADEPTAPCPPSRPCRSSCGSGSCRPSAARSSPTCRCR